MHLRPIHLAALLVPAALVGCSKDSSSPSAPSSASVTVASVMADLKANAAKYDGKPVKLSGVYMSTSTMEVGGKKSFNVSVVESKTSNDDSIGCEMGATEPPAGLMQYTPVTIEGKGKVSTATKGGKELKVLRLTECKLTK